ncbi:hypothetical protein V5799_013213 [Amblyomma americanum]|uniref:Organic cation/carnitine transporter n=1 Tax=Amblyomma americanum TaxID=6943 RepID=A0AAQ4E6P5_AMBAM
MELFCPGRLEGQDLLSSEDFDCYDGFGHGAFQRRMLLLCTLTSSLFACHTYAITLTAADVDHWCKQPLYTNVSAVEWRKVAIPVEANGRYSQCRQYAHPDDPNDTRTIPCSAWDYDETRAMMSMVSQWDLVCERRLLRIALTMAHGASMAVFGIAAGCVADSVGRKPVLLASIAVLLVSTLALCLARTYVAHAVINLFTSASASATNIITSILFFEVTTHGNRPLHVVIAVAVAVLASDLWFAIMRQFNIHWALKQAIFLAPTYLTTPAFCLVIESPRWLVAKGRFQEAEDAMLAAAEVNLFPLHNTACLSEKLKTKAPHMCVQGHCTADPKVLQGASIRKRAMVAFFCCFSGYFVLQVVILSPPLRHAPPVFKWISIAVVGLSFAAMMVVITRLAMLQFISTCFAMLFVLQCLLSLTATIETQIVRQGLAVCAKALSLVGYVVYTAYSLELFPTAIRGTASGWIYGFGGLGAISSFVCVPLRNAGRDDVAFTLSACLMFASLQVLRTLPRNTTAECAKFAVSSPSRIRQRSIDHMKRTLEHRESRDAADSIDHRERRAYRSRSSRSSSGRSKSSVDSFKSTQSTLSLLR